MLNYPIHTIASAPQGTMSALEQLQKEFGVLPNLPAVIASSSKLINSLVRLFLLDERIVDLSPINKAQTWSADL